MTLARSIVYAVLLIFAAASCSSRNDWEVNGIRLSMSPGDVIALRKGDTSEQGPFNMPGIGQVRAVRIDSSEWGTIQMQWVADGDTWRANSLMVIAHKDIDESRWKAVVDEMVARNGPPTETKRVTPKGRAHNTIYDDGTQDDILYWGKGELVMKFVDDRNDNSGKYQFVCRGNCLVVRRSAGKYLRINLVSGNEFVVRL